MNTDSYNGFFSFVTTFLTAYLLFFTFPLLANSPSDWQLNCPQDVIIHLPPGECNIAVDYDTLSWSSSEGLIDTIFFPASGNFFGIGTASITLAATTYDNQLEVCNFNIIVHEFVPHTLDCKSNVTVSLNGSCERTITPTELLLADSAGCMSNYTAARISTGGGVEFPIITALDIGLPFTAVVQHQSNMAQCSMQVIVTGGVPPSITCPADISIACNSDLIPFYTGHPDTSGCYENLNLTYQDETALSFCVDDIRFQTTRTFTASDPVGNVDVCEQMITGIRVQLSEVVFPPDYDGVDQMKLDCSDTLTLEELTDPIFLGEPKLGGFSVNQIGQCDVVANFTDITTNFCGASANIMRIWSVVNTCDATDNVRDTQYIEVVDKSPPVYSLPDTIYASLNPLCFDSIFIPGAEIIEECSNIFYEIRTAWDTLLTNGGWSPVGVAGSNQYPVTYKITDQCGNFSFFTSILKVEDKTLVSCPANDTITCDLYYSTIAPAIGLQDYETLNELGQPVFHGNCGFTFSESDSLAVDGCGQGIIVRKMTSDSVSTDVCQQVITVSHISNYSVQFPADISICSDPQSANLIAPVISGQSCENVAVTQQDVIIDSGNPGCYTLERTYVVLNSCAFSGTNLKDDIELEQRELMDGGDGIVEYTQTIVVNATDGPAFTSGCGFPDLPVFQNNCEVTVTVPNPIVTGCGTIDLTVTGDLGIEVGENVNLTMGTYVMNFTATDECGKVGTCVDTFAVVDNTPPVAVCKPNIVATLMPTLPIVADPIVNVWAIDLNGGSSDNCNGSLKFFFLVDDSLIQVVKYECNDKGLNHVTLVVEDPFGNSSSCETEIIVQDGPLPCSDKGPYIGGKIAIESGEGINNVEVKLEGGPFNITLNTDTSGQYSMEVPMWTDLAITPIKNTSAINGVTTYDAVLMTRHILNVDPFTNPYQIIAADINNSGTVTTYDIVEMRKLVLFIYTNFPTNSSWRFVPADYVFPNPSNPWEEQFPESILINNLFMDMLDLDFIGVKIGDLNGSADPKE